MDPHAQRRLLEDNALRLADWFRRAGAEEVRWRPAPRRWSALEVLGHLRDEETDDFRPRIRLTLEGAPSWPPIDPEARVVERGHQQRDPAELLSEFSNERARSLEWLGSVADADWDASCEHPQLGRLRAGDLLASWTLHDALHLRQLACLRADWIRAAGDPYSTRYAGG